MATITRSHKARSRTERVKARRSSDPRPRGLKWEVRSWESHQSRTSRRMGTKSRQRRGR